MPGLNCTLLSTRELTKKNWTVIHLPKDQTILKNNNIELKANWKINAYYLDCQFDQFDIAYANCLNKAETITPLDRLHKRFLHTSKQSIIQTLKHVELDAKFANLANLP